MVEYGSERLGLDQVGSLSDGERALIREWLVDNFCTEDTFECELHELENGGFSLVDAMDSLSAGDDSFGVHVLTGDDDSGFLVVLFEDLPQGIVVDRRRVEVVASVIDGDIAEVSDGYEEHVEGISQVVPALR